MIIYILAGLTDKKLKSKLLPLTKIKAIDEVILFRRTFLEMDTIKCISPPQSKWIPIWLKESMRIWLVIKYLLKQRADYIIGFHYFPQIVLSYGLARLFKTKYIAVFTGSPSVQIQRFHFKSVVKHAFGIGVRGHNSEQFLINMGVERKKLFIQRNVHVFRPAPGINPIKKYDLLFAGNLIPVKKPDFFIEVVHSLMSDFPNLKVAIAGQGIMLPRLTSMTKVFGIEEHIHFLGYVHDIESVLNASKILVMTSISEGLPMVMIEAMGLGIPCIVPDVGDITDVAKDHVNARVLSPLDLKGYVGALKELLYDESIYHQIALEAKKIVQAKSDEYSLDHIVKTWQTVLK